AALDCLSASDSFGGTISSRTTGMPALAQWAAMPLPITPAPSTATRRIGGVMPGTIAPGRQAVRITTIQMISIKRPGENWTGIAEVGSVVVPMSSDPGARDQAAPARCTPCLRVFADTLFVDDGSRHGDEVSTALLRLDFEYEGMGPRGTTRF